MWLVSGNGAEVAGDGDSKPELLWDRKTQGGFPELKDLVRLYFHFAYARWASDCALADECGFIAL